MVKFSPLESPAKLSVSPLYAPTSLIGSLCGQSSAPVTVLFFCSSTSFSPRCCSTVNVQVPAMDFSFASTLAAPSATPKITTASIVFLMFCSLSNYCIERLRQEERRRRRRSGTPLRAKRGLDWNSLVRNATTHPCEFYEL